MNVLRLPAGGAARSASEPDDKDKEWWLGALIGVPAVALGGILVYAWDDWAMLAVAALVGGSAFVAGGLFGFLFGIPRHLSTPERKGDEAAGGGAYEANTNLEQISDWLTKILVGVGLVQFGALAAHAGDLVDFLGPAFGDEPLGETFAGATLVIFSITGFLTFYLVTRIHLGGAFARGDRNTLMSLQVTVAKVKADVKQNSEDAKQNFAQVAADAHAQSEADAHALILVGRQLDPSPGAAPILQLKLDAAVADASPAAKAEIFGHARDRRRGGGRNAGKPAPELTIPVFEALIAAETDRKFHRSRGQLGYALHDSTPPESAAAETVLSDAIETRNETGDSGYLRYEMLRALRRIRRCGADASPDDRAAIEADLARAEVDETLRAQIAAHDEIGDFRSPAPRSAP